MDSARFYSDLEVEACAYFDRIWFTNLANLSAVLMERMPEINWVGFYLLYDEELWLGPFQGRAACLRIPIGKGVCGTAASKRESLVVPNVELFPTHIVCDSRSKSELVVPLISQGRLLGVLDVDSPKLERFSEEDRKGLEKIVTKLVAITEWPGHF